MNLPSLRKVRAKALAPRSALACLSSPFARQRSDPDGGPTREVERYRQAGQLRAAAALLLQFLEVEPSELDLYDQLLELAQALNDVPLIARCRAVLNAA